MTQTPSSDPVVLGSTVKVDVKATNIGSPMNALFIAPLDSEEEYVEGSVYGGAFPVTAAMASELAKHTGVATIDGLPSAADAGAIVGVAAMAKPGTGGTVNFGFSTIVTSDSGQIHHSVAVFDTGHFVRALHSDFLPIKTASETLTDVFGAIADTHIAAGLPSINHGDWPFIYIGGNDVLRGLVQFDISAIDPAHPVDMATLWIYVGGFGRGGSIANLAAHEVMTGWAENTVTWKTPWTAPGGDVDPVAVGAAPIAKTDVGSWIKINVTASAQKWVADPAMNHGLLLRLTDATSFTVYRMPSTENSWMGSNAPKLEVTYRKP